LKHRQNFTRGRGRICGQLIEALETRTHFAADLSAAITIASPASHQVKPGQTTALAVTVSNVGDAAAKGKLQIEIGNSISADGSSPTFEVSGFKSINLAPGRHVTFRQNLKVPKGFTPGTYFAVVDVDPGNTFGETNLTNNVGVSANTLTVLSQFPLLGGTWSGAVVVKKGFGKGSIGTQTDTFTSENQTTGGFTIVGTNTANGATLNFTASGFVTTSGVVQDSGVDTPIDSFGEFKGKGKVIGTKVVVNYTNALNSGTVTLYKVG
jgi:hypothetical protein